MTVQNRVIQPNNVPSYRNILCFVLFLITNIFSLAFLSGRSEAGLLFESCTENRVASSIDIPLDEEIDPIDLGKYLIENCGYVEDINILVEGKIGRGIVGALKGIEYFQRRTVPDSKHRAWWIKLSSPGGLINPTMSAGRYLANLDLESNFMVTGLVNGEHTCLSSCVLLLVGTPKRIVIGKVGLHRPSRDEIESDALNYEGLKATYDKVFRDIESYLDLYGVSSEFIDIMKTTSSSDMRILTDIEIERLGLQGISAPSADISLARAKSTILKSCGRSYLENWERARRLSIANCKSNYEGLTVKEAFAESDRFQECVVSMRRRVSNKYGWKYNPDCQKRK
jgi:hypothetical protein